VFWNLRRDIGYSNIRGCPQPFQTNAGIVRRLDYSSFLGNPSQFISHFITRSEELYLVGFNAVKSVESQRTFRRNISAPSSCSKNKPSIGLLVTCFDADFFLVLLFDPEDGDDTFLWNVS
jgi:hypothetical protein